MYIIRAQYTRGGLQLWRSLRARANGMTLYVQLYTEEMHFCRRRSIFAAAGGAPRKFRMFSHYRQELLTSFLCDGAPEGELCCISERRLFLMDANANARGKNVSNGFEMFFNRKLVFFLILQSFVAFEMSIRRIIMKFSGLFYLFSITKTFCNI